MAYVNSADNYFELQDFIRKDRIMEEDMRTVMLSGKSTSRFLTWDMIAAVRLLREAEEIKADALLTQTHPWLIQGALNEKFGQIRDRMLLVRAWSVRG